jgi:hypothetical protein
MIGRPLTSRLVIIPSWSSFNIQISESTIWLRHLYHTSDPDKADDILKTWNDQVTGKLTGQ